MQISKSTIRYLPTTIWIVVGLFMWALSYGDVATADVYSDSAHGNTIYGVNRSNVVEDPDYPDRYAIGACIHCHDTFDASICGVNPLMLFAPYDENFCFGCHKDSGSYQTGGIDINKSYSCNFGGNADEDTYDTDMALVRVRHPTYNLMKLKSSWELIYEDSTSALFASQEWGQIDILRNHAAAFEIPPPKSVFP